MIIVNRFDIELGVQLESGPKILFKAEKDSQDYFVVLIDDDKKLEFKRAELDELSKVINRVNGTMTVAKK